MSPLPTYFNWSGGKDSALALYHAQQNHALDIQLLLTSVNTAYHRVSMHGVRTELLRTQAQNIGIPLQLLELPESPSMEDYNAILSATVADLKNRQYQDTVFGDIFLEELRAYREEQLEKVGIRAHFPLWKRDTKALMTEFLALGFKAIVVCVKSECLDASFTGRVIDESFVKDLPAGVDICGENGEYHSFVYDGPIFKEAVPFTVGEKVFREYPAPKTDNNDCFTDPQPKMGFWFCDLMSSEI